MTTRRLVGIKGLWARAARGLQKRATGARSGYRAAQGSISRGLVRGYVKVNGTTCLYGRENRPFPFLKAVHLVAKQSWCGFLRPPQL